MLKRANGCMSRTCTQIKAINATNEKRKTKVYHTDIMCAIGLIGPIFHYSGVPCVQVCLRMCRVHTIHYIIGH